MVTLKRAANLRPCLVPLIAVILVLSGCVTTPRDECQVQAANTRKLDLTTQYHLAAPTLTFGPLPRSILAEATLYRVSVNEKQVRPCQNIMIQKDLYLRRNRQVSLIFKETREFYAEDGTLIASNTEDLSNQLRGSGRYTAETPLPIPSTAPPGNYLIVSNLAFERRGERRSFLLGRTEVTFRILPRSQPPSGTAQPHRP